MPLNKETKPSQTLLMVGIEERLTPLQMMQLAYFKHSMDVWIFISLKEHVCLSDTFLFVIHNRKNALRKTNENQVFIYVIKIYIFTINRMRGDLIETQNY